MRTNAMFLLLVTSGCDRGAGVTSRSSALQAEADVVDEDLAEVVTYPEPIGAVLVDRIFVEPDPDADLDGDGFSARDDADDHDPFTYPGAREQPCNGADEDGDGFDWCPPDVDGDGVVEGPDCDDLDPDVGPLANEVFCNGIDENCDGQDSCDRDGDGVLDDQDPDPDDPDVGRRAEEPGRGREL